MDAKPLRLRSDRVSWREIEEEVVAVDVATSTYVSANASGKLLWKALAEGTTRDELVSMLADEYSLEPERAAADVDRFLAELAENGLLED